ncbi:hypothetical protein [Sphingomonas xanthus]|uniref:Uncharacterized protein n=1 Tax=Sphingomonas xanthus TaxID=2594473 RepID=A0A516IPC4_9SPHN|nr:hypothetical protein [Sphingomonas xanthus]QDP18727.1 hypothetical protein FMM02_01375 [Sphingomonas xanthus]
MMIRNSLVALVATIAFSAQASSGSSTKEPSLAEVRALTAKYQDVNVALAEGYVPDPMNICETAEMMGRPSHLGAMGVHFFRPDLLGITSDTNSRVDGNGLHTDFRQPSILIYEPQADGSMKLVAVENLVFAKAWHAAGNKRPPRFHGVEYDTMKDDPSTKVDEAHMFEPHYDRHVWIYRDNPNGMFAQFNPNVKCPAPAAGLSHSAHQRD